MKVHIIYPANNRVDYSYDSKNYVALRNNTSRNATALKKEELHPYVFHSFLNGFLRPK